MISMIVAMGDNNAIGKNNELLWHLPDDFKHFKSVTMGKPILMGRKTYQSIGRPLPGRENIVVTRDKAFLAKGVTVVGSIEAALEAGKQYDEVMVIGGASFYQQMLPMTDKLYVTHVHHGFEADAFFPDIAPDEWRVLEKVDHVADEKHKYSFSFVTYKRISK
ncbi:MAG: dihydrofolate reductase [Piscirickettsiaceae bacterium]|nr:MAG: dihydrofolate reductase [Piscirickettsiaceae bacterium]PCI70236.1 MAG: dihydrofolate reductase [Piscirickettsiaceae bacterium]